MDGVVDAVHHLERPANVVFIAKHLDARVEAVRLFLEVVGGGHELRELLGFLAMLALERGLARAAPLSEELVHPLGDVLQHIDGRFSGGIACKCLEAGVVLVVELELVDGRTGRRGSGDTATQVIIVIECLDSRRAVVALRPDELLEAVIVGPEVELVAVERTFDCDFRVEYVRLIGPLPVLSTGDGFVH